MALDPSCSQAYQAVFSDDDPTSWCKLAHEGKKLARSATGKGGLSELVATFNDSEICFCLLRLTKMDDGGDSKRTKFVYLVWCAPHRGESYKRIATRVGF